MRYANNYCKNIVRGFSSRNARIIFWADVTPRQFYPSDIMSGFDEIGAVGNLGSPAFQRYQFQQNPTDTEKGMSENICALIK